MGGEFDSPPIFFVHAEPGRREENAIHASRLILIVILILISFCHSPERLGLR